MENCIHFPRRHFPVNNYIDMTWQAILNMHQRNLVTGRVNFCSRAALSSTITTKKKHPLSACWRYFCYIQSWKDKIIKTLQIFTFYILSCEVDLNNIQEYGRIILIFKSILYIWRYANKFSVCFHQSNKYWKLLEKYKKWVIQSYHSFYPFCISS